MNLSEKKMQQILKEEVKREIREQKEVDKQISLILEHANTMKADGASRQQINEEIWRRAQLNEGVFDRVIEAAKEWLVGGIMGFVGVDPNGFFAGTIKTLVGNLTIEEWKRVVAGDCELIGNQLTEAVQEHLSEKYVINKLAEMIGISPDGIFGKTLFATTRETISGWLGEFTSGLREPLTKAICSFDLSSVLGGSGGWMSKFANKIMGWFGLGGEGAVSAPTAVAATVAENLQCDNCR